MSLREALETIREAETLMKHHRKLGLPDDVPTAMKQIRELMAMMGKLKRLEAELEIKEALT